MVEVSEVNLIECPDCKRNILDNVNYCRYCGHDFNEVGDESSGKLSRFLKKSLNGTVNKGVRYCIECKYEIRDFDNEFCENCGATIPYQNTKYFCRCGNISSGSLCFVCNSRSSKKELSYEEYYQFWHNQVIIPLSKKYNKDLSKSNFKEYFNLTKEEENHIIYIMVHNIIFEKINGNIIEFFETVLKETKQNYEDIEKALFNEIQKKLNYEFNNKGIISSNTSTIKKEFTETIETPHIKNKHGAGTKVLATAVAGPIGFAATSGVKQETNSKKILHKGKYLHEKTTLNKNEIIYESYEDDDSLGFKYSMNHSVSKFVFEWEDVKTIDEDNYLILNSGDTIKCTSNGLRNLVRECILNVMGSGNAMSNAGFFDDYTNLGRKKAKKIMNTIVKNHINNIKSSNTNDNSSFDISSLEKITDMYKEGLLTDEEFAAMKKKIINMD